MYIILLSAITGCQVDQRQKNEKKWIKMKICNEKMKKMTKISLWFTYYQQEKNFLTIYNIMTVPKLW